MGFEAGNLRTALSASIRPEIATLLADTVEAFVALFERRVGDRAFAEGVVRDALATTTARADDVRDETAATDWLCRSLCRGVGESALRTDPRWSAIEVALHGLDQAFGHLTEGSVATAHRRSPTPSW